MTFLKYKTAEQSSSLGILKKTAKISAIAAAIAAMPSFAHAESNELLGGRLHLDFLALQGFQSIQAENGAFRPEDEEQTSGFERIRLNLQLKFDIYDHITADVDIAEEPNDFGNNDPNSSTSNGDRDFSFHQDFAGIEFELLGLSGAARDNADLTLRIGNIGAAPFQFKGFQDGADNQSNALIGNSPVDYATAENGIQLSYTESELKGIVKGWNVAGHITSSSFGEQFQEDRGYNLRLQGTLNFVGGFNLGLNIFQADQGGQLDFNSDGVASLDGVTTTNYRFGDGENYNFTSSGSGARDTHIGVMPGLDMSIIQLNLAYQPDSNTSLIAMFGRAEDDYAFADATGNILPGIANVDSSGNRFGSGDVVEADSAVDYFVLEAQQYLVPEKFYLAARYTEASNETDSIGGDNKLERTQIAAGYWFNKKTLWKTEFVDQDEGRNSGGQIGGGFSGFVSELSVKF